MNSLLGNNEEEKTPENDKVCSFISFKLVSSSSVKLFKELVGPISVWEQRDAKDTKNQSSFFH